MAACTPTLPFLVEQETTPPPVVSDKGKIAQVDFADAPPTTLPHPPKPSLNDPATGTPMGLIPEAPRPSLFTETDHLVTMAEQPRPFTLPEPPAVLRAQAAATPASTDGEPKRSGKEPASPKFREPETRPLAKAVNAFLDNRPEEAMQHLKGYAPRDQELVMQLLPILAEVERDGLLTAQPRKEAVQAALTVVRSVDQDLRASAPLVMEKLSFCADIEAFGVVKKRANNKFRPGEYVFIYAELQNLVDRRCPDGHYAVRLASTLEIRAADGRAVHRYRPIESEPLLSWTPRTDFFTRIGFNLPADLQPGLYSLRVRVTDLDTGRTAEQSLALQVLLTTASRR
jgi:hypothetical protein